MRVIKPFVLIDEKNSIERWCIYLSDTQGDHITLAVKSSDMQLEKKFSSFITKFLETNPSEKETAVYPLQNFFMDYPNNSIVFDKEKSFGDTFYHKEGIAEQEISKSIIEAFSDDLINTESAFAFFIYMQLGIVKAVFPDIRLIPKDDILQGLKFGDENEFRLADGMKLDQRGFIELIETNKDIMPEIMHDIWAENKNPELEWLYNWIRTCKSVIGRDNFKRKFIELSHLICSQLGLNKDALIPLSCQMISRSFN